MPGTHSTGQLLLWLVYRRGLHLLLLFVNIDTRYSRVVLVSLDPRYSRIGVLLLRLTDTRIVDPIDVLLLWQLASILSTPIASLVGTCSSRNLLRFHRNE